MEPTKWADSPWNNAELKRKLMSKRDVFSNEDVRTKMSILKLVAELEELLRQQHSILEDPMFGPEAFIESVNKYMERGERDYRKHLRGIQDSLRQNIALMELKHKSNFIERELRRAFREEQKVEFKQKSLELKKQILGEANQTSSNI